jgi:sec-independent protein translocase protein TatC
MVTYDDDDLFKSTSMTFGEHLEELRAALFKGVVALLIGFAIGLLFGSYIVSWIQSPLEIALKSHFQDEGLRYALAQVPDEMRADPEVERRIAQLIYDHQLIPEARYFSPAEMLAGLKQHYPQEFASVQLPVQPPGTAADANRADTTTSGQAGASGSRLGQTTHADLIRIFVWRPLQEDERLKLMATGMPEPFVIYLKASFLAGAILSSPFVFYFLWQFVAAGLYPHEKKYVHLFLPVSVGLFLLGAAGAFFFVFPPVLGYFFWIADSIGVEMRPRLAEWLSFVLLLPLGFGIAFQLPLVMLFLERIHLFTVRTYLSKWRIAVLLMAIAAMVLSPGGDPYSMMMMLGPLVLLYFGGIALCYWLPSGGQPTGKKAREELAGTRN